MLLASRVRRAAAVAALLALAVVPVVVAGPVSAADTPVFGTDHDDPTTADKPVSKPDTRSCTERVVDHGFDDFDVYTHAYAVPAGCAGPWSKVVLTMHGSVKGVQYDRLGWMSIGDVPVLKFSTPEPSADGIEWTVEKDLTPYAALLRSPQTVKFFLGNVVNDTYTGVLDMTVDLTFYTTSEAWPAAETADDVVPLADTTTSGGATTGTLTVPANTERLLADVYETGSGGGCEEFWYTVTPSASPDDYSCKGGESGPWREVQVYVDGTLAGVATPYPHIYTGGWSNPYLWATLPAPRALDIAPATVDLTPFVGELTDGEPHRVQIKVDGAQGDGWDVPTGFRLWQDAGSDHVAGALVSSQSTAPVVDNTVGTAEDGDHTADLAGRHSLTTEGWVQTSHGRVTTTVTRTVTETVHHQWSDGEYADDEQATFEDAGTVRTQATGRASSAAVAPVQRWDYSYGLDGALTYTDAGDISTTMTLTDEGTQKAQLPSSWRHVYTGSADWNYLVPRAERKATGWSQQDFTDRSPGACWHRVIRTEAGWITSDRSLC
ncbi:peptide-N4-asparagine amidase [Nocardioides cheoyonin]|uniref:peptide-N4-asparagine amidase n=1 Tax=Nocardioides cheoyonin TaxID=3156615 RepID=UPI0032B4D900